MLSALTQNDKRKRLGRLGESKAAEFLIRRGLVLIGKNLDYGKLGELDLLMGDECGKGVRVVEVKTVWRRDIDLDECSDGFDPIFKIDRRKQNCLYNLARLMNVKYPGRNIFVDLVAVRYGEVEGKAIWNIKYLPDILRF